jgi:membrane-associated phospholipid phosphatase
MGTSMIKAAALLLSIAAGLLLAGNTTAQDAIPEDPSDTRIIWQGFKHTYTAPARWESPNWRTFGMWTGVSFGAFLLDDEIRDVFRHNQSATGDGIERVGYWYGSPGFTVTASLAGWGLGALFESPVVRETGLMIVESLLMVGLMQQPLRIAFGRARPKTGLGNTHFKPFTVDNNYASFVSGHTWSAVAFSTILSLQIDNAWASVGLYGLALTTPLARMYSDDHWFSDVVMGSAAGFYSARTIWRWHKQETGAGSPLTVLPVPGGLVVAGRF